MASTRRPDRTLRFVVGGIAALLTVAGCRADAGVLDPADDDPADSVVVASVTVSPDRYTLTVLGSTVILHARARDAAGSVLYAVWFSGCSPWLLEDQFRWTTDVPGVVAVYVWASESVASRAALTALAEGRVQVTASVGGVQGQAVVDVVERARVKWSVETLGAATGIAIGEDGTIYMAGTQGLQAVSPEGDVRWGVPSLCCVRGTPAIAEDGTLYVGMADGLTAIDPDGNVLWATPIERMWSPPAIGSDGTIHQGTSVGILYAVDRTGRIAWRFEAPGPEPYRNNSPPAIAEDGTIYFASEDGHLYATDPDGSERWRFRTAGPARAPSIGVDGTIYFGNDRITRWSDDVGLIVLIDSRMFALNLDGTERWSAPLEGDVWAGPAIGFDGSVYMGTINQGGDIYVFAPDGSLLRKVGGRAGHTPIVAADGSIYRSLGAVSAIDGDGTPRWSFQPGNFAGPLPAIGFDGTIYAGAHDGAVNWLYAFEELGTNNGGYHAAPWPTERGDRANTGRARRGP